MSDPMSLQTLFDFETEIRKLAPSFEVRFKDESRTQKFIGILVWIFNRTYMTQYTTTLYPIVWFPSRALYVNRPQVSFMILAHELVHLQDTKDSPIWFRLGYVFPQALTLLAFLAAIPVAFLAGWWALVPVVTGILLLVPWPAPWRVATELRGYGMSLALTQWRDGVVAQVALDSMVSQFVGAGYYYMSWSRASVEQRLLEYTKGAAEGTLQQQEPYGCVHRFMSEKKLLN
jgi:hypothetical protein